MELTLVVVGAFTSENSKTANCILGGEDSGPFEIRNFESPCELETTVSDDGQTTINVINTPGSFSMGDDTLYEEELSDCTDLARDGIHAFLLVVSIGSWLTNPTFKLKLIQSLQQIFGESSVNYFILVFSENNFLQGQSFAEFLDQGCPDSLKDIIRLCNGRYVLFDTDIEDEVQKSKQVQNLLSQVKTLLAQHDGESFKVDGSTNWYSKGETSVLIRQINKSYEEQMTQRIDVVLSNVRGTTRRLEQQLAQANSATTNVAQRINVVESRLTETTTRLEHQLEIAMVKVAERAQGCSKGEILKMLQQNNRSYEEQIAQRINMHFAEAQAAMLKADERAEGYYKGETSELIQRIRKSHEKQMKQRLEEVESRVKDVTIRLEQQLTEAEAARLKADERAQEAQKNSNKQIQMTYWTLWVQSIMFMILLACLLQSMMI